MLAQQATITPAPASIIDDRHPRATYYPVERHTTLKTDSAYRNYLNTPAVVDGKEGEILAVVVDPFGSGATVCYVASLPGQLFWTAYVPIREVPEWHMFDCICGKRVSPELACHECGRCYECCECQQHWLDDDEFPDYRED